MLVRRLTAKDGPVEATITFDPRLASNARGPRIQHRTEAMSWSAAADHGHRAQHNTLT
jgi:hypothetical protein